MRTQLFSSLLFSFSSKDDYYKCLNQQTLQKYKDDLDNLIDRNLPPAISRRCLGVLFGLSPKFIGSLIENNKAYYRIFKIPKGKKSFRKIEAPRVGLKIIQKWISLQLSKNLKFLDCVYGFIPNKSHVEAAKQHLEARWVYSIDIKDFFQSTSYETVLNAFINNGYRNESAKFIASLCCYNKNHLPQGSPASPVISNMVFKELDTEILELCKKHNVVYTRYADDLVFSGKEKSPDIFDSIKDKIKKSGWELSDRKEKLSFTPKRLKVHGLLVHRKQIRLTKGYRNKIRAYKYILNHKKNISIEKKSIMIGHIGYSNLIEKAQ